MLTHTDAAGVKTTSTYYTDGPIFSGTALNEVGHYSGDLKSVSNAAGHQTTYDSYDRAGRLLQSTDPNGLVTKYSYTPRGWLKTQTVGTLSTSYDYWPTGLLKRVSQPDGSALYYQWDDAHRLTDVSDQVDASGAPAGNGVGNHTLTASYWGDTNNTASTSSVLNQVVSPAASGTTLNISANAVLVGDNVTLSATVSGTGPTGTVSFMDGSDVLGSAAVATCVPARMPVASRRCTAMTSSTG